MNDVRNIKKDLQKNGFVKISNFFTNDEIIEIKKSAATYNTKYGYNSGVCSLSTNLFDVFYKHSKLKTLLNEIIGKEVVFWGEATVNKTHSGGKTGIPEGYGVFHKDNTDRTDQDAPDWQTEFTIFRLGIYLDDYSNSSGGIGFRKYSHKKNKLKWLWNNRIFIRIVHLLDMVLKRSVYCRSKPGDLVIWYLTTDHAGNCKYLKFDKNIPSTKFTKSLLPKFLWSTTNTNERITLFTTFGKKDNHLDRHFELLLRRKYMIDAWKKTEYSSDQLKDKQYPFDIIDMPKRVRDLQDNGELNNVCEDWVKIPY